MAKQLSAEQKTISDSIRGRKNTAKRSGLIFVTSRFRSITF